MVNHPNRSKTLSMAQAMTAARLLVRTVTNPDREWTIETVRACLPNGWLLSESATQDYWLPLSIENATIAYREFAIRETQS